MTVSLKALRGSLESLGIDCFLVTELKNVRYLTGFTGSNGYCLITSTGKWFFTDSRYTEQSKIQVKGYKIKIVKNALSDINDLLIKEKIKSLGFESSSVVYSQFEQFKKVFQGLKLKPTVGLVEKLRLTKSSSEIALIKDAINVANHGFKKVRSNLSKGKTEKELAILAEFEFKKFGAEGLSFPAIIASGKRGALPHATPSDSKVKSGELVIVDMGVTLKGYNSDETRTFMVGKPTKKQKEVYLTVKEAHDRAIEAVRAGVKTSEIDFIAREVIDRAGFGKYFIHSTGHGVGLNIHEQPSLASSSTDVLEDGMVVTVEPGIYIAGWGGVRIEDMILVKGSGYEVLTNGSKEFKPVGL